MPVNLVNSLINSQVTPNIKNDPITAVIPTMSEAALNAVIAIKPLKRAPTLKIPNAAIAQIMLASFGGGSAIPI